MLSINCTIASSLAGYPLRNEHGNGNPSFPSFLLLPFLTGPPLKTHPGEIDRITVEVYRDPARMVDEISALGLRHVGYGIPTVP